MPEGSPISPKAPQSKLPGSQRHKDVREAETVIIVDAANVIGARPDGWWQDRSGSAARFVDALRNATQRGRIGETIVVVLEGKATSGAAAGRVENVEVLHSAQGGDDLIVSLVAAREPPITVVTADRELRARVKQLGASLRGPSWLRRLIDEEPTDG
jgi:hypothetical protein